MFPKILVTEVAWLPSPPCILVGFQILISEFYLHVCVLYFYTYFSEIFDSRSPGHIEIYFIKILVSIFYIFLCEEVSFLGWEQVSSFGELVPERCHAILETNFGLQIFLFVWSNYFYLKSCQELFLLYELSKNSQILKPTLTPS